MNLFGWLFKRDERNDSGERVSQEDLREALGRITSIAPHLKLANRYEARLAPGIGKTLGYARELVAALPSPRDATPAAWSDDPHLRTMFATPDDIVRVIGDSRDVRAWFDEHFSADFVFAVLSCKLVKRRMLGVEHAGDAVRRDVERTAIGFEDKRMRICAETDASLRKEIVLRVVEQLTLEAMSRAAAQEAQRDALREQRALITARMQLLGQRGAGMHGLVSGVDSSGDLARLQHEFAENEAALAALGSRAEAVEQQFRTLVGLLSDPAALIHVTHGTLRVNQMNLIVEAGSDERGADVAIHLAHIPMQPEQIRAVEFVRIARKDVPPAGTTLDDAAHWVL